MFKKFQTKQCKQCEYPLGKHRKSFCGFQFRILAQLTKESLRMRSDMKCCFANTRPAGIAINDVIPMHFEQSTNVHIIDLNVQMGHEILSVEYSHFVKFFTLFCLKTKDAFYFNHKTYFIRLTSNTDRHFV